ncbi:CD63 antigen-like [Odontomachus brunneus]|uniref:CD63 antigen-like n=1 Tax=Odontomachus brunneus TaxID=486640 RepID=UPI0013F1FE0E|nr:CD63 antigen-like [Odontomachus brunneus]XP_032671600.1 CD63 antigen-like [Odontomachus brunneus]
MGCGMGMIKYLLFIFNFIFALCGLAILIVGVIAHLKLTHYADAIQENVTFPSITLIVIGSIIFVIAFFGCCGAIRESHCMTVTFACMLLTILIIQVAVAIYAFVVLRNSDDIGVSIRKAYADEIFAKYNKKENAEIVNDVQALLGCCGVDNYGDFQKILGESIPYSCCDAKEGSTCTPFNASKTGCAQALQDGFKYAGAVMGGLALGVAAVELIGIIFALCLANSIKNEHRRGYRV